MKKQMMGVLFAGVAGTAGAYQFEGIGSYTDFDGLNDSQLGLTGVFHFANVDDKGVPLAEAGFLRRSSNVSLGYTTFDEADADGIGANLEMYLGQLYLAAGIAQSDVAGNETNPFSVRAGFLPMDGLRLTLGYSDLDDAADTSLIEFEAKYVAALSGDMAINAEFDLGQVDDSDDTVTYSLLGDLFFTPAYSAGLRYSDSDAPNSDAAIGLRARAFFIPALSAQVEYTSQDNNDRLMLGVTGRF